MLRCGKAVTAECCIGMLIISHPQERRFWWAVSGCQSPRIGRGAEDEKMIHCLLPVFKVFGMATRDIFSASIAVEKCIERRRVSVPEATSSMSIAPDVSFVDARRVATDLATR